MLIKTLKTFKYGIVTKLEDYSIPDGAASASNNWITQGDRIELRRGMLLMGTEITGAGKVTCLHTTYQADGTEILYRTRGQKIEYYDTTTKDWIEVGTNQLGSSASGEDVAMSNYQSLSGSQLWISSPNSSIYKIMTANPGNITDMYNASKNYKGYILIKQNRTFLWHRKADATGLYGSHINAVSPTTVTSESIGIAGSKNYSGTLAFKAGNAEHTCYAVTFTDGTETFTDNLNGTVTGSLGGSGTINYTTGAYAISFAGTAGGAVTSTYQHEDANENGISDFTYSGTRVASEGFIFRQDDGGTLQAVASYKDIEYCLCQSSLCPVPQT